MRSTINMFKERLGVVRFIVVLLLVGIVLGTIAANLLQRYYIDDLEMINRYFGTNIQLIKINYGSLLKYVLAKRLKEFIIIIGSGCIVFGVPLLSLTVLYKGLSIGFAISSSILCYGFKGIILYIAYVFPQCIIFVPVYFLMIKKSYSLCDTIYFSGKVTRKGRKSIANEYIPIISILLLFQVIGCLVETYINSSIVKNVIEWVMKE